MRILLVEDNPGDVYWFRLMVQEMGASHHQIIAIDTAVEALAYLQGQGHEPPDLVVTDFQLQMLTLEEFVEGIRAIPGRAATPIAVCTGLASYRPKALAIGAICCIEKPVNPERLGELFSKIARGATA